MKTFRLRSKCFEKAEPYSGLSYGEHRERGCSNEALRGAKPDCVLQNMGSSEGNEAWRFISCEGLCFSYPDFFLLMQLTSGAEG